LHRQKKRIVGPGPSRLRESGSKDVNHCIPPLENGKTVAKRQDFSGNSEDRTDSSILFLKCHRTRDA
jgi:hypothetical protein